MIGDALVLAEHEPDFAPANADIARRHIHIGADMPVKLGHEALAEAHDLAHALALGIEIRAALAAAHRQAGQRILEGLLEGQELEYALIDGWMKADAPFVRPDRIVVLDAPAALHANIAVIVLPADAKGHHPVWLGNAAQNLLRVVFLLVGNEAENVLGDFLHRLDEFGLVWVAPRDPCHEPMKIDMFRCRHLPLPRLPRTADPLILNVSGDRICLSPAIV